MFFRITYVITITLLLSVSLSGQVIPGDQRMEEYLLLLTGRKVGIVANPASVINGRNIVDTLIARGVKVYRIFCPEHGFRSWEEAGRSISNRIDSVSGVKIISLYGEKKKPAREDLRDLDLMLFDLQDVGVRFYTYISTLSLLMEACAENSIPMILLDRPNPNGFYIDGPVLRKEFSSFVGMHPVPVVYGMTIGEYARMVNREGWLSVDKRCDLTVIPVAGYTHRTPVDLPVKPSPNLTTPNAVLLYPSLCFFEGTIVSVGRGTPMPFEIFGHPALKGFSFSFVPGPVPGMCINPSFKGELCRGLDLRGFYSSRPKLLGRINLNWLIMAFKDLGSDPAFFNGYFDTLAGTDSLRIQIMNGMTENQIRDGWQEELEKFREIRAKYLLYAE